MRISDCFVTYEIRVPTFFDFDGDGIGDLLGVKSKISNLTYLGIDTIVLTSVFETSNADSFYEVTDFCRVNPQIGEMNDMTELIAEAHRNGLRVLLSVPLFCTSVEHPWFEKRKNPKFGNYYVWAPGKGKDFAAPPNKKKNILGEDAWVMTDTGVFHKNTYGSASPDLNLSNPELRNELCEIAAFWKDLGIDGFLLDSPDFKIEKTAIKSGKMLYKQTPDVFSNGKNEFALLAQIKKELGKEFILILRNYASDETVSAYLTEGDSPVADALIYSSVNDGTLLVSPKEIGLRKFVKQYVALQNLPSKSRVLLSLEDPLHARFLSSVKQFQNEETYFYAAKTLALLLACSSGGIALEQGQEIAMSDVSFHDSAPSVSEENTKSQERKFFPLSNDPYQWDNKKHAGFTSALFAFAPIRDNYVKINRRMQENDPESVLNFYKKILNFRNCSLIFQNGDFVVYPPVPSSILCFTRTYQEQTALVIVSLSPENVNYSLPRELLEKKGRFELGNYKIVSRSLHETVGLRPFESRIYLLDPEIKKLN